MVNKHYVSSSRVQVIPNNNLQAAPPTVFSEIIFNDASTPQSGSLFIDRNTHNINISRNGILTVYVHIKIKLINGSANFILEIFKKNNPNDPWSSSLIPTDSSTMIAEGEGESYAPDFHDLSLTKIINVQEGEIIGFNLTGNYSGTITFGGSGTISDPYRFISLQPILLANGVITSQSVGSTNPAGSDTQIQFNDGGSFGASSDLTFNKTTNTLTTQNLEIDNTITMNSRDLMLDHGTLGGTHAHTFRMSIGGHNVESHRPSFFVGTTPEDIDDARKNVAVGPQFEDTDGNTYGTMYQLTTGDYNVGIGHMCLGSKNGDPITGSSNTAVGQECAQHLTSSSHNTMVGQACCNALEDGDGWNVAVGRRALERTENGSRNTAVGDRAGSGVGTGTDSKLNTAVGYCALSGNCGDDQITPMAMADNTAIGAIAGESITSGSYNTLLGSRCGHIGSQSNNLTTGNNNVLIGYQAMPSSSGAFNQIVIGQGATGTGDNKAVIGNADVTDVYMAQDSGANVHCSEIRFKDGTNSNYVGFKAPTTLSNDFIFSLPNGYGSQNQVLQTDGNGVLSWVNNSGGGGGGTNPAGSDTHIQFHDNGSFGASSYFTFNATTNKLTIGDINTTQHLHVTPYASRSLLLGTTSTTNATGHDCVLIGNQVATYNSTSNFSNTIAIGTTAAFKSDDNWGNVVIGTRALFSAARNGLESHFGSKNIAVGYECCKEITTGYENVAVGLQSLMSATTGDGNVSIGYESCKEITTGKGNVGIGSECMKLLKSHDGDYNVAIGKSTANNLTGDWNQLGGDIDGEASDDQSGYSVAMSSDGSRIAISATKNDGNGNNSGHVRVYDWDGSAWTQVGSDIDGEAANDESGGVIAMSSDGSRVVIGATKNDGNGNNSGHVRVYDWDGSAWTQVGSDIDGEAADDENGFSVAISHNGSRVVIGAAKNDGNGNNSGHVRVYELNGSAWTQVGSDIDGEAADDQSGYSVAISHNGSRVAIGAVFNDNNNNVNPGHVRVHELNGSAWNQLGGDIDGEAGDPIALGGSGDESGVVAMSSDGSRVAIGAMFNDGNGVDSGHVRVYDWDGSAWTQVGNDIDGEAGGDYSGFSVAISDDGSRVAIGAIFNDGNGNNSGHVRVYDWDGSAWTQVGSDIDGEAAGDESGVVAMSSDGSRIAIGAIFNDGNGSNSGHVRVYKLSGAKNNVLVGAGSETSFPGSENQIVIGQGATGQGDNKAVIGNADVTDVYMAQDSGATVHCGGIVGIPGNPPGPGAIGTGAAPTISILKQHGIITTTINLDLKGLSRGNSTQVVGMVGAGAAYITEITPAINGTLYDCEVICVEAVVGMTNDDFDLYSSETGTYAAGDGQPTGGNGRRIINNADFSSFGSMRDRHGVPGATGDVDRYIYLSGGGNGSAAGPATAGKIIIRLFGFESF